MIYRHKHSLLYVFYVVIFKINILYIHYHFILYCIDIKDSFITACEHNPGTTFLKRLLLYEYMLIITILFIVMLFFLSNSTKMINFFFFFFFFFIIILIKILIFRYIKGRFKHIFFDTSLNSESTVIYNIYEKYKKCAQRFFYYQRKLPFHNENYLKSKIFKYNLNII